MTEKKHLVLDWIFDVPKQELYCTIGNNLKYIALKGGTEGIIKLERNTDSDAWSEKLLSGDDWIDEKFLISKLYGDTLGYYQPDVNRVVIHPVEKRPDNCLNGVGPDGRYLDHLQRIQSLLENEDVTFITATEDHVTFFTPDGGKTILKSIPIPIEMTNYKFKNTVDWHPAHPQPCAMHPHSPGRVMSSYEEMESTGVPKEVIEKCKEGKWQLPLNPEIFTKHYVY